MNIINILLNSHNLFHTLSRLLNSFAPGEAYGEDRLRFGSRPQRRPNTTSKKWQQPRRSEVTTVFLGRWLQTRRERTTLSRPAWQTLR